METEPRTGVTPQLVIGIFIMLFGLVLTLERLRVVASGHLRLFWPLALVALGTSLLIRRQDSRGRFWGIFWTTTGGWLLLNAIGLIPVSPGDLIVPLIFILIGGTIVSHTMWGRPIRSGRVRRGRWPEGAASPGSPGAPPPLPSADLPQSDPTGKVSLFAMMGEARRTSNDKPFRGGEMTAIMGGCVLDLRQAEIAPGEHAVLNILAVMAGHEVWVPPGWSVASDVVPLLGGVDDKRLAPLAPLGPDAPRLVLKGVVLMGGAVIKN